MIKGLGTALITPFKKDGSVDYEALALLGKQIVAGTNYAYLCKATVVAPDAQPYLAVVFVYQTLEGDCELLKI